MGMLDELPFVNEALITLEEPAKLFCYTDGLVEVIQESGIEFGTENLEKELTNNHPLEENIQTIINNQKILEGSASIFDDISIIGAQFPGASGFD
jgi:serine phosphatase RsbU (regulator of sigma subunit)